MEIQDVINKIHYNHYGRGKSITQLTLEQLFLLYQMGKKHKNHAKNHLKSRLKSYLKSYNKSYTVAFQMRSLMRVLLAQRSRYSRRLSH